jgi:hypothetical protein
MKNEAQSRLILTFLFAAVTVAASAAFAAREEISAEKLAETVAHVSKFISENNSKSTCTTQGSVPSKNIFDYLKNASSGSILKGLGENQNGQSIELSTSDLEDSQGHKMMAVVRLTEVPGSNALLGVVVKTADGTFIGQIFCSNIP